MGSFPIITTNGIGPTKRKKPAQLRLVEGAGFCLFSELIHDALTPKPIIIFVSGKDCRKPKKDDLTKHESSTDHVRSTSVNKQ